MLNNASDYTLVNLDMFDQVSVRHLSIGIFTLKSSLETSNSVCHYDSF